LSRQTEIENFLDAVRDAAKAELADVAGFLHLPLDALAALAPSKMLRSRLAGRLFRETDAAESDVMLACAAVELLHAASLCHDDVIDNAVVRRARPALWKLAGTPVAVLLGDMMLCRAIRLLAPIDSGVLVNVFAGKMEEVCRAEARHEMVLRGRALDAPTCMSIARGKTGPLFAFTAWACGRSDEDLAQSLEEAGYLIGTAYQLLDDLIDVIGDEQMAKKTLGTDRLRRKYTLVQDASVGRSGALARVDGLLDQATGLLDRWPKARAGLWDFIDRDFRPLARVHLDLPKEETELAG
jgi:geranylgeranyl pyrophosphate synthase